MNLVSSLTLKDVKKLLEDVGAPVDSSSSHQELVLKEGLLELQKRFKFAILFLPNEKFNPKIDYIQAYVILEEHEYDDTLLNEKFKSYKGIRLKSCFALPICYAGDITTGGAVMQQELKSKLIDITADFQKVVNFLNITKYPYYNNINDGEFKKVVNKGLQLPSMFLNNVQKACENGEPGFSFNFYDKEKETARNACQPAFAKVLTKEGVRRFDQVDVGTEIWSVDGWTTIVKKWSTGIKKVYEVLFSDNRSKFIGTLNHKLVTGVNYKDDSFIKTELQDIILDKLPVKTFSYDFDSILMRDLEGLIAGRFTEESHIKSHKLLGEYEVFDITVDNNSHTYWTEGVNVSNCTEVTSEDDSDVCNLASINMAEIETYEEFCLTVAMAYKFLFCGTLKADLPYDKVYQIREKNRRIGLGLMGNHS